MKLTDSPRPTANKGSAIRPLVLAGSFFVLGAAVTGFWLHRPAPAGNAADAVELSAATQHVLAGLTVPVTIHYFSLLPAGGTDASLPGYATRVGRLLDAMQAASGGRLKVTTIDSIAETNEAAASAAGLHVFNLEKGQPAYLGLALASGHHQEIFDELQPEWEPALEFDLDRALQRVAVPEAPAPVAPEVARPAPEIVASVNRLIPDVASTSVETADQIFHGEFMKELGEAGTEIEAQMAAAQQQVTQAQASGSATDLEAAQKNLAKVQSAQGEKIRQIATELKTRMAVFQALKSAAAK